MFIKRLSINYFGSLLHFDAEVNPKLAIIESHYTEEIYAALGILFNIKSMPPYPNIWIFEEDMMTCFSGHNSSFSRYFSQYLSEENSCSKDALSKLTGGYSDTHAFRSYLTIFMKNHKSELLRGDKLYEISILRNGRFIVTASKDRDDISDVLSESEKKLFSFVCFFSISEFWYGFENIRNMHYTGKPLVVMDFLEYIDKSVDMQIYFDRAIKFERQVIILTLPNNSKKEM